MKTTRIIPPETTRNWQEAACPPLKPGYDGQIPPRERAVRDIEGDGKREITVEHRIDRLQWMLDHKAIGQHHFDAGRRLQADWQTSKIEVMPRMEYGGGGQARSTLTDAACDAVTRLKNALDVLPSELLTLLTLFLLPEDHPQSLERCAAAVRLHPKAASFGLRAGLSLLARHYGLST
jgi:hypothetical protein